MTLHLNPRIGLINKNNAVQLNTLMDCRTLDAFNRSYNNTDQQGGTSKFTVVKTLGGASTTMLDYSQYGLGFMYAKNGLLKQTDISLVTKSSSADDLCFTATFNGYSDDLVPGGNGIITNKLIMVDAGGTNKIECYVIYNNITDTWSCYRRVIHYGVTKLNTNTSLSLLPDWLMGSLGNCTIRNVTIHIILINSIPRSGGTMPGVLFYINGCLIDSLVLTSAMTASLTMSANLESSNVSNGTNPYYEFISNFGLIPVVLYGNGITIPYECAFASDNESETFLDNGINGLTNYQSLSPTNILHSFSFKLKKKDNMCKYPISISLPYSGGYGFGIQLLSPTFEHINPNRLHNSYFVDKNALIMIDNSISIDENSVNNGAIFDGTATLYPCLLYTSEAETV